MTQTYEPSAEGGIRLGGPTFDINWPPPVSSISEKDAGFFDYQIDVT